MADKKMTQKRALELAIDTLLSAVCNMDEGDDYAEELGEARSVLQDMYDKRVAPKPKVVDEVTQNFRDTIINILRESDSPMTNKDLQENLQDMVDAGTLELPNDKKGNLVTKVTPQRIANNIKVLEKEGAITRLRGEKASDKDAFILA